MSENYKKKIKPGFLIVICPRYKFPDTGLIELHPTEPAIVVNFDTVTVDLDQLGAD